MVRTDTGVARLRPRLRPVGRHPCHGRIDRRPARPEPARRHGGRHSCGRRRRLRRVPAPPGPGRAGAAGGHGARPVRRHQWHQGNRGTGPAGHLPTHRLRRKLIPVRSRRRCGGHLRGGGPARRPRPEPTRPGGDRRRGGGGGGHVAGTRVLLGVHWLTDVLAGLAVGWAWFALWSIAFGGRLLEFGARGAGRQHGLRRPPVGLRSRGRAGCSPCGCGDGCRWPGPANRSLRDW